MAMSRKSKSGHPTDNGQEHEGMLTYKGIHVPMQTLTRHGTSTSMVSTVTDHLHLEALPNPNREAHGHQTSHAIHEPVRLRHLFKRPVVRQWTLRDKFYYEKEERAATQVELFFDLIMVGVVHSLAEGAAEEATTLNAAKFVLLFFPAWSIWTDVRNFMNVSGTDDVVQRIYLLIVMGLLLGYSANATGIMIAETEKASNENAMMEGGVTSTAAEVRRRASMPWLIRRTNPTDEELVPIRQIGNTGYSFAEGYHEAIAAAFAFYLVAKCCRLALYFAYGWILPPFRKALWLNSLALLIIALVYLPILFASDPLVIVLLICSGIILELALRYVVTGVMQFMHGRAKHRGHSTYMPAYALPHLMERMVQFTILVMGESIVNAQYKAMPGDYGLSRQYGRAVLALGTAFFLVWLYFDNDSSRTFVHALKRGSWSSISFTHLHFPLCAGLLLMSATLKTFIEREYADEGFVWMYSVSIATVMVTMGCLGLLHKSLDLWASALIPKSARIASRFILGIFFAVMPLMREWKSLPFLATHAALLIFAVSFETVGKLHAVGRIYDPVRAEQLRQARNAAKEHDSHSRPLLRHVKGPNAHDSWHEYADLTPDERGEEDVGIEPGLGQLEEKYVSSSERWAYVET